jgi:hypothetical protein
MFCIKWRNRNNSFIVVTGISTYSTRAKALKQVDMFQVIFPSISYYVERVTG